MTEGWGRQAVMGPTITSYSGNDQERASAGVTVGDTIYSMSPETEAESLRGPLGVGGKAKLHG